MPVTVFDHSFIRHWAMRGKTYDEISKMLAKHNTYRTLTPHDVLMILLEMSHEHQRESTSR